MSAILVIHVAISLVAIAAGFVILYAMLTARPLPAWHWCFLITTILTSVTGFFFPFEKLLPSHILGILSLLILAPATYAYYAGGASRLWRTVYAITATTAFYLNFFVLIVQSFHKIPALHELAPTDSEPPFAIAQGIALLAFIAVGYLATKRYRQVDSKPAAPSSPYTAT